MGNEGIVRVRLVYAGPGQVWRRKLRLPAGATVGDALEAGRFAEQVPNREGVLSYGIFGRTCRADHVLADGDRVEIYRPLVFDPMESRRRRAAHRAAIGRATL
jgi:putative ubiquitin-RnfH superfamily antitoxin RatB of RatAB toxin-antitoxin module